jgi:hypothetical protein
MERRRYELELLCVESIYDIELLLILGKTVPFLFLPQGLHIMFVSVITFCCYNKAPFLS